MQLIYYLCLHSALDIALSVVWRNHYTITAKRRRCYSLRGKSYSGRPRRKELYILVCWSAFRSRCQWGSSGRLHRIATTGNKKKCWYWARHWTRETSFLPIQWCWCKHRCCATRIAVSPCKRHLLFPLLFVLIYVVFTTWKRLNFVAQIVTAIANNYVVFWPVHTVVSDLGHWVLCVIYPKLRCFAVVDSLQNENADIKQVNILSYIQNTYMINT